MKAATHLAKRSGNRVIHPWQLCIRTTDSDRFEVKFLADNFTTTVESYEVASITVPEHRDIGVCGTRVVAQRRILDLPYEIEENSARKSAINNAIEHQFYPGIIAGVYDHRYLVFFDDGIVQILFLHQIRKVFGNDEYRHAHSNARKYFEFFLNCEHRDELKPDIGDKLKVEWNGKFVDGTIEALDKVLARIRLGNRCEWLYLGSPRIKAILRRQIKKNLLNDLIDFRKYTTHRLDSGDDVVIESCEFDESFCRDISRGVENVAVRVAAHITQIKPFNYRIGYNFEQVADDDEPQDNLGRNGCDCTDNCRDKLKCSCWKLTVERMYGMQKSDEFEAFLRMGYKDRRLSPDDHIGIVECGSNCRCCERLCGNRVVQQGLQYKLEIFDTRNRGMGVRTKVDIPRSAFVCDYAGDVLQLSTANKRCTTYQFELPRFKYDSDECESESDAPPPPPPPPKKSRQSSTDDIVEVYLHYFPLCMENGNTNHFLPSDRIKSRSKYVIDGLRNGNVSRFLNHSCEPNLGVQWVYTGNDKRFPRIAFFALKNIKARDELTIDYSYSLDDANPVSCLCGKSKCRKRLR